VDCIECACHKIRYSQPPENSFAEKSAYKAEITSSRLYACHHTCSFPGAFVEIKVTARLQP